MKRISLILFVCCFYPAPNAFAAPHEKESADSLSAAATMAKLVEAESQPLGNSPVESKPVVESSSWVRVGILCVLLIVAGLGVWLFMRVVNGSQIRTGNRKFLIEKVSYCPLGPKSGVSLLRIGREFILVGVTANQVNFLKELPSLEKEYSDESDFERTSFKSAVAEEFSKLRNSPNTPSA